VFDRSLQRGRGDLVEDHPLDRYLGRQHLVEVPGDRLPLTVLVRCKVELVGLLHEALQVRDDRLLLGGDDIEGLEPVVDVDAEPRPLLPLVRGRDLVGPAREVADVTDRRFDDVVGAEHARDRACLGR
jgi:hypothetical protein